MSGGALREHFPAGFTPRPEQTRLLDALEGALAEADLDAKAPRLFVVEAPPGVGKSHLAVTLARWSGDAYLLTSQKLLQDQYEREFGGVVLLAGRPPLRGRLGAGARRDERGDDDDDGGDGPAQHGRGSREGIMRS